MTDEQNLGRDQDFILGKEPLTLAALVDVLRTRQYWDTTVLHHMVYALALFVQKLTERMPAPRAEAGGGLTSVESDIHGGPEPTAFAYSPDLQAGALGLSMQDVVRRYLNSPGMDFDDEPSESKIYRAVSIELRDELRAVRETLLARDDEETKDAAIRWRDDLRQLEAEMHDIDEARGMLCGELIIDDTGNTVEVMRQAALAIGRHRLTRERGAPHRSGETDHAQCGLGTLDDGPRDSDCPCRTGADLSACAAAGCSFCRAEISLRALTPTRI